MTSDARVRVLDPIPIDELFDECRRLLHAGPEIAIRDHEHGEYWRRPSGITRTRRHDPDVGLAAWLWVDYAIERPLPHPEDIEDLRESGEAIVPHTAMVKFDCGGPEQEHVLAYLTSELCVWLALRGRRFEWSENGEPWYDTLVYVADKLGDVERGRLIVDEEIAA